MENVFRSCRCCGRYYSESPAANKLEYCSRECEEVFLQCSVCGNYYMPEEFFDQKSLVCSKECSRKFKFKTRADVHKLDFSNL